MTDTTIRALWIPADPTTPAAEVEVPPTLEGIRARVGTAYDDPFVEVITLRGPVTMWVDEDGQARALPFNPRASRLTRGLVFGGDNLRGDVLVTSSDDEGETVGLSSDDLAWLRAGLGVTR